MNPTTTSVSSNPGAYQGIWVSTAEAAYPTAIIHGQRDGKCRIIYSGPVRETLIDAK